MGALVDADKPDASPLHAPADPMPLPLQQDVPRAAPAGGNELLRELRRENIELQRVRQELEATQKQLAAKKQQQEGSGSGGFGSLPAPTLVAPAAPVAVPAPAPAVEPTPAPAPAAAAPAPAAAPVQQQQSVVREAEEAEEEGGSLFGALNLVGILAAGGLYGYLSIQKKQAAEAEAAFQQKLTGGERGAGWGRLAALRQLEPQLGYCWLAGQHAWLHRRACDACTA